MSEQMFFGNHRHATLYCQNNRLAIHLIIACFHRFYHVLLFFSSPVNNMQSRVANSVFYILLLDTSEFSFPSYLNNEWTLLLCHLVSEMSKRKDCIFSCENVIVHLTLPCLSMAIDTTASSAHEAPWDRCQSQVCVPCMLPRRDLLIHLLKIEICCQL